MALTFTEQHEGIVAEKDTAIGIANVDVSATRRFLVPGYAENTVLNHPSLPGPGTPHPRFNSLRRGRMRPVERVGGGEDSGWIVEVEYKQPELIGRQRRVNKASPGYKTSELEFGEKDIDYPILFVRGVVVPSRDGTDLTTKYEWGTQVFKLRVPMIRLRVDLSVQTFGTSEVGTIAGQVGKIHQFGGRDWVFEGGSARNLVPGEHLIGYSWFTDPGNAAIPPVPGLDVGDGVFWPPAREPHGVYFIDPTLTPPVLGNPPLLPIRQRRFLDIVPNGFIGLPGSPI